MYDYLAHHCTTELHRIHRQAACDHIRRRGNHVLTRAEAEALVHDADPLVALLAAQLCEKMDYAREREIAVDLMMAKPTWCVWLSRRNALLFDGCEADSECRECADRNVELMREKEE